MTSRLALTLLIIGSAVASRQTAPAQPVPQASPSVVTQIVLLTIEGTVEVAPAGTLNWVPARTNQVLNIGDRVHTGEGSRATILLTDRSVQRVGDLTTLEIRPPTLPGRRMMLDLKAGKSYLFNREKPTELQFRTPLASGAIRGTEFELSVDEATGRTVLTLIEGEVLLSNDQGDLTLASGDQGTVDPGQAPRKTAALDTRNVIQWTLYYPAVLVVAEAQMEVADQQALADSLSAYRVGDAAGALARYPAGRQPATDAERLYRAALFLTAGDVPRAETMLGAVAGKTPLVAALRKLIAAVKGESFTGAPPTTATASLADSYYRQSRSELPEALRAAKQAVSWAPGFGPAWIRVAELEMSFGRKQAALAALERGLELAPRHAQGHALRGFVLAQQGRTRQAQQFFNDAIALDPALANGWLGRGLCRHRHGDTAGGREDLQVAATLEPTRSLLRSYLGKSWAAEGDLRRAEKDLTLAQQFDPNDPTSWLYLALVQQRQNRINESVSNLEHSKALNDNRSLFQSRFRLEQDLATRSANLAGVYRDAGMFEWSTREASRAVGLDYGNFSAHLFLANSYDALRDPKLINLRYETPWLSEQLVANLLAPAAAGAFPRNIAEEPYSRLFEGDRLGIVSSTEYFSSGEWIERGSYYGIFGNSSFSLDAFYHTDPGQRPNNDLEVTDLSATFKQQLSARDNLFLRVEDNRGESGDLAQYYYQTNASTAQRVHERQDPNAFIGWHREWAPGSHTLFLGGYLEDNLDFNGSFNLTTFIRPAGPPVDAFASPQGVTYETDFHALTAEIQQIWQNERHTLIFGARAQGGEVETSSIVTNGVSLTPTNIVQDFDNDLFRGSAYAYWFWQVARPLQLQAGVSYDYLDYPKNAVVPPISDDQQRRDQVSPKLGFQYTPWTNTTLRGAWTRSLGGVYFDTSVRLEPTQIGGFNQAFRSLVPESVVGLVPGTRFETFGAALEQKLPTRTYLTLGGEWLYSDADRMIGAFDFTSAGSSPTSIKQNLNFRERTLAATVSQLLGNNWSFGATYRLTDADLQSEYPAYESSPRLSSDASTHDEALLNQVTLFANYNCRCGFFGQWWTVWSQQDNKGGLEDSDFWQHNVAVGYRFPGRHAELRVSLLNILDQDYRLNPLTLYNELPRERTLAAGFKFYF